MAIIKKRITAKIVSDYFIWISKKENKPVNNLKLQKLLYYAQAWYLVFNDKDSPLFRDKIEAWIHGPAIKSVFLSFKGFGHHAIKKEIDTVVFESLDDKIKEILNEVWNVYGKYDSVYLEELSHNEKPWQNARENLDSEVSPGREISLSDMKLFYTHLLNKKG